MYCEAYGKCSMNITFTLIKSPVFRQTAFTRDSNRDKVIVKGRSWRRSEAQIELAPRADGSDLEDHTETPSSLPGSQSPRSPRPSDLFCSVERRSGGTGVKEQWFFVHAT